MPAAILFRGHAHREPNVTRAFGVDWRKCVESHRRHLIEPLKAQYKDVHIVLSTYATPHREAIEIDYGPWTRCKWFETGENTQRQRFIHGLEMLAGCQKDYVLTYDLIVTCRFDLELLKCPLDHGTFRPDCVNWLWKEWNAESWNHHRRVPDAIHLLPGELLEGFRRGVAEAPSETCMHLVHDPVARHCNGRVHVMQPEGYTDSNTDIMPNPVYRMVRVHG